MNKKEKQETKARNKRLIEKGVIFDNILYIDIFIIIAKLNQKCYNIH